MQTSRGFRLAALLILLISIFARTSSSGAQEPTPAEIPIVKGGAGPCSADFVLRDSSGKGIYDAKIVIEVRYGFMGLRRLDLTVGTNFEGKARVEGLPEKINRQTQFKLNHGTVSRLVPYDPQVNCQSRHEVIL